MNLLKRFLLLEEPSQEGSNLLTKLHVSRAFESHGLHLKIHESVQAAVWICSVGRLRFPRFIWDLVCFKGDVSVTFLQKMGIVF